MAEDGMHLVRICAQALGVCNLGCGLVRFGSRNTATMFSARPAVALKRGGTTKLLVTGWMQVLEQIRFLCTWN